MNIEQKIEKARELMAEVTLERREVEKKITANKICKCGHKRKFHTDNYNVNYTGGFCTSCKCEHYLEK